MSKKGIDQPIPSGRSWDGYRGKRVQEYIEHRLGEKASAFFFDPQALVLYGFATDADKEAYIETGDPSLAVSQTPFEFNGTVRQVKVSSLMGSASVYFTTSQPEAMLRVAVTSQEKGITESDWRPTDEDFSVSVLVDRGSTGTYEAVRTGLQLLSGQDFEIDVRNWLATGANRVRIVAVGKQTGEQGAVTFSAYLTTMYIAPADFAWHVPFVQGRPYRLGGVNIGGNLPKTLVVAVSNENGYYLRYEQPLGSNTYINTAYTFNELEFPSGGTGIYNVEMWLEAEGLESDHLKYNIMCIAAEDAATAQLVAVADIKEPVDNCSDNTLFRYACYNGGAATADIGFQVRALVNQNPTLVQAGTLEGVETGKQQSFDLSLELETEETNLKLDTRLTLGSCEQQSVVNIDNTRSYPAATGATFYINPAARSNADADREKIVNAANPNAAPLAATWSGMTWASDGWTTDDAGRKCLLIPAGARAVIPISMLAADRSMSVELAFRADNVSDYDEPVIAISSDVAAADPYWVGIKAYPTKAVLHSNALHSNDLQQSYGYEEGKLVDLIFSIAKPYKSSQYGNVAFIFANGVKKCTFPFSAADSFASGGSLVLGSDNADLYVYKVRHYASKPIEAADACRNFVNSLATPVEKQAAQAMIVDAVDDNFRVDYDKVRGRRNTMVVEMLDGNPLPAYGMTKDYSARANVGFEFMRPYEHEGATVPSWAFSLLNVPISGQGSTSMNYWLWNLEMRPEKADDCVIEYADGRVTGDNKHVIFDPSSGRPAIGRITPKKNYASPMQSHKMGATAAFNDLHHAIGLDNEEAACVAVYQEPVYGFLKTPIEGTSQYRYEFIGLFTVGPSKGDKNTFGYNGADVLALEGLNHNIMGVGFDYPWGELQYIHEDGGNVESICVKKSGGEYDKAIEVSQAGSAKTQEAIAAKLEAEFKPAYELAYGCSTMIMGVSEDIGQANADPAAWRERKDSEGHSFQRYEFWTDGDYDVWYYNVRTGRFEKNGTNLLTQLGKTEADIAGLTIDEKNEMFKRWRREKFRAECEAYFDVPDNLFAICFLFIIGATDNFKKNFYPYKLRSLASGSRWRQRQDDLDTIFKTDNQGLDTKGFSIEMFDWTDAQKTAYVFKGEDSRLVRLFAEAYADEFMSMGRDILAAMYALGSGATTLERLVGFFKKYFFDKAQGYFSKAAYNHDAEIAYEEAYPAYVSGRYSVDVSPLAQSKGDATEAEMEWITKRMVYVCSYFRYGMFGDSRDASCGRITFRTQSAQSFTLTPAIDLYPAIAYGESNSKASAPSRVRAGESVTLPNVGGSNTNVYIMASDWLSDIGDLCGLSVDSASGSAALAVSGKRLLRLKIGDADPERVTSNLATLQLGSCPAMVELDARNLASLTGTVDLSGCSRMRRAWLGGTSATAVLVMPGARLETLELPSSVQSLDLRSLAMLEGLDTAGLALIGHLRIENCPTIDSFGLMARLYNSEGSLLRNVRLIGFEYDGNAADAAMLANMADGLDKDGNAHAYKGIGADGIADEAMLPVVEGTLRVADSIYRNDGDRICRAYPRLALEVEGGYYVWFDDPEVRRIMIEKFGNGEGVTEAQAQAVTNLREYFKGNTEIETFNELPELGVTRLTHWISQYTNEPTFQNCTSLREIDLSNITFIERCTFQGCTALETIGSFSPNITEIRAQAFENCTSLRIPEISLPNLEILHAGAFAGVDVERVTNLGKITDLPYELGNYRYKAIFDGCENLCEVILPDTLQFIDAAFVNCTTLKSPVGRVKLSRNLTRIGKSGRDVFSDIGSVGTDGNTVDLPYLESMNGSAFKNTGVEAVTNLGLITVLPDEVFRDCTNLRSVVLPHTLRELSYNVFLGCTALESLDIPDSVSTIRTNICNGCSSLQSVHLPSAITVVPENAFLNCDLREVVIPEGVTSIDDAAFRYNRHLHSVTLPNSLIMIKQMPFSFCDLQEVTIPANVTDIKSYAFADNPRLSSVIMTPLTPPAPWQTTIFNGCSNALRMFVPDEVLDTYKTSSWKFLVNRIFPMSDYDPTFKDMYEEIFYETRGATFYNNGYFTGSGHTAVYCVPVEGLDKILLLTYLDDQGDYFTFYDSDTVFNNTTDILHVRVTDTDVEMNKLGAFVELDVPAGAKTLCFPCVKTGSTPSGAFKRKTL